MLDKDDLQAIGGMLDQQKTETMQEVSTLMESKFMPMFNLLLEGHQAIIDKLIPASRVDELEEEMKLLKIVVRQLSEDVHLLKKTQ